MATTTVVTKENLYELTKLLIEQGTGHKVLDDTRIQNPFGEIVQIKGIGDTNYTILVRKERAVIPTNNYVYLAPFKDNSARDKVNNFLRAAGAWEYGRAEELLDPKKFKAFFGRKNEPFKTELIYAAESGIDSCPAFLGEIQVSFKHFSDEIDFAMNKIVSDDTRMYEELNFLKRRLYDLFHLSCYKGDPSKYLGQFFWNTLGWWNEIYGDRPSDWIADAIEKLRR